LRIVTEPGERALVFEKMVESAKTKKLSENFPMAQRFPTEKGWSCLDPNKPIATIKLEYVIDQVGFKSRNETPSIKNKQSDSSRTGQKP
jgi:hypothetical protein